jgi:hypothetical protein
MSRGDEGTVLSGALKKLGMIDSGWDQLNGDVKPRDPTAFLWPEIFKKCLT